MLSTSVSNNLIQLFSSCRWARRGDIWEAADLMQQMNQEGVQPDIHTYTSFINACCKAGDMLVCFADQSLVSLFFTQQVKSTLNAF
jgi:hypothetical protein